MRRLCLITLLVALVLMIGCTKEVANEQKKTPQYLSETQSTRALKLTFKLPSERFVTDKMYYATASLTNLTDKDLVFDDADLFQVSYTGGKKHKYWSSQPFKVPMETKDGFSPPLNTNNYYAPVKYAMMRTQYYPVAIKAGEAYSQRALIKFPTPGVYTIYCRLSSGPLDTPVAQNYIKVEPPELEVRPIKLEVK